MGKMQRTRGAAYEREVCDVLTKKFGTKVSRKLGQARDGGDDIEVGNLLIECKRRRRIAVYAWLDQINAAAKDSDKLPVVVARADGRRSIAILDFEDFLALVPDDGYPKDPLAGRQMAPTKPVRPVTARGRSRANKVGSVVETVREEPGLHAGTSFGPNVWIVGKSPMGAQAAAVGRPVSGSIASMVPKTSEGLVAHIHRAANDVGTARVRASNGR
jgi:hypothetical protein